MKNKIIIDLDRFKGQTSRDLKAYIEQNLSNIRCSVEVPGPYEKSRKIDFRLFSTVDLRTDYEEYRLVDVVNEN